ncbi:MULTISPECIES: penicillin-binding protein 1A [Mesonia]|uniref:Penicillin-binding protein 1A n=1 Tax=Mesonia oceanica TaxID=2687242 RepID=A0AC61Y377_9FLAO|nr:MULTISPECIES: transglycosylase domain-containing protein [Mesonia]MAN28638.1 penicillin-binding protein [Mesonia sp.]MAQ41319.1 penicillin-binding protein [Mesonia sp.]MBJ97418.1 penicillin-binding protein [Flavobacteriaceae bacterium]VVU98892.1 Penicillin-binding protein 1A [Mesonia oceanica]
MTSKKSTNKTSFKKFILWFWGLFLGGVLIVILLFLMAGWGVFGKMPTFEELENPETNLATEVFSSDGKTLGKYYNENRTPVKYEDLPNNLVNALVATEDERYYDHSGVDARGTLRAVAYLGSKGGASTITQQLSKLLFSSTPDNKIERVFQKIKEWVIAVRLERQYTKQEIITMYFNKYDFLYQAVGVRSASRIYFGKEPKDLKTEEAAVLVAMLKNPIYFNPAKEKFKDNSLARRNQVLKQMEKNGYLTTEEKDSLQKLPLKINFSPEGHDEGVATYFRAYLQGFLKDWIEKNPKPDGEKYNIYRDGLKVYTSIDSRMQKYAEEAVKEHMKNLQAEFDSQNKKNKIAPFRGIGEKDIQKIVDRAMRNSDRWREMKEKGIDEDKILASFDKKAEMRIFSWENEQDIDTLMTPRDSILYYKSFLNAGMMSMEPQTGEVKAWVGGINFKHFKYEHVKQARRQVGSTFKPFVYATAIDQLHLSPCYKLPNTIHTIPAGKHGVTQDWSPRNSGGEYGGMVTLKNALARSLNTVTSRVIDKVGPEPVIDLLSKLGVNTENIQPVAAIALGTVDLSVFEMVSAYSTFANKGVYVKPVIVNRIEDKNGTVLYQHVPESRDVMSEEAAYVTINLMEGVTQGGSGTRLRTTWSPPYYKNVVTGHPYEFKNAIAGKTGTTQNQSDGWFMGIVPNLVTGVWVGGEDRAVHFPSIRYGQGATMALPIWGLYMKKVYADKDLGISKEEFERPENLSIEVDCSGYEEGGGEKSDQELLKEKQEKEISDDLDF